MMGAFCFTFCLLSVFFTIGEGQRVEALFNQVMNSYNTDNSKFVRPSGKDNDTLQVSVGLSLIDIVSVDVETGLADLEMYLSLSWYDGRLRFRPRSGISTLHVPHNMIWTPDIVPYRGNIHESFEDYYAVVTHDGTVTMVPKINYKLRCGVGMARSSIHCTMTLGSWTMNGNKLNLQVVGDDLKLDDYSPQAEWRITETQGSRAVSYYSCCPEPYVNVKFGLTLE